eukprot:5133879-Amphidinium_carterae.1
MGTVVPSKESHPYTVAWLHQQIRVTGHRRILFKSDQEPSIQALKNAVVREPDKSLEVVHEESAVKDSDGNGAVEQAVRILADEVRVLKCATDSGFLGRTPYELSRGRKMNKPMLSFGEACLYRPLSVLARKLDARWEEGIYLTTLEQSLEHIVG